MSSIAGVLTWISFVFTPGRPRCQRVYDAARLGSSGKKADRVDIRGPLQRQLKWWVSVLSEGQFKGSRVWSGSESPATLLLRSDASGDDGWGACIANFHVVGPWPEELLGAHMLFKELLPVAVVVSLLAPMLAEVVFGVAVDNTGAAFAVNRLSCRDDLARRLLQQLASDLDAAGHTALAAHVRRHRNVHADDMSHALQACKWAAIRRQHKSRAPLNADKYWSFPFVVQCLVTGECYSALFRMRKTLF